MRGEEYNPWYVLTIDALVTRGLKTKYERDSFAIFIYIIIFNPSNYSEHNQSTVRNNNMAITDDYRGPTLCSVFLHIVDGQNSEIRIALHLLRYQWL